MDSSTLIHWTGPFPVEGMCGLFLFLPCFIEIPVLNANSVDIAQTPRSVASYPGLHCLPISLLGALGINWSLQSLFSKIPLNQNGARSSKFLCSLGSIRDQTWFFMH